MFGVGARVRVLAATAPRFLPRLGTGCGESSVTAYGPITGEYTVKPLAMYSRQQTHIPKVAVVATSRDGNDEMYSRGMKRSSEGHGRRKKTTFACALHGALSTRNTSRLSPAAA